MINIDKEQDILIESLKNFAESKDLTKSEIVNVKILLKSQYDLICLV